MNTQIVTEWALIHRLNRKLWPEDRLVKKTRGARSLLNLGPYYVLDWRRNLILQYRLTLGNLEAMGHEEGVLADYEKVTEGAA